MRELNFDYRAEEVDLNEKNNKIGDTLNKLKAEFDKDDKTLMLVGKDVNDNRRIVALHFKDGIFYFINPLITNLDNIYFNIETLPNEDGSLQKYIMPRYRTTTVSYVDVSGAIKSVELKDEAALLIQQANERLDGIEDSAKYIGFAIDEDFINADSKSQEEVLRLYMKSLKDRYMSFRKDIEQDSFALELLHAIEFTKSVNKGETVLASAEEAKNINLNREQRRALARLGKKKGSERKAFKKK